LEVKNHESYTLSQNCFTVS